MTLLQKSTHYLAATLIGLPLAALLLPLLYGMGWMLLFTLVPLCVGITFKDAFTDPAGRRQFCYKLLLATVCLPMLLLAFMAPCRAILLMLVSWWPEQWAKLNEVHAWLYEPLRARFGVLAPYWMDFYWGILALLAALAVSILDSMRRNMLASQVAGLPTSKVRSVAIGLAELVGKAVPAEGGKKEPIARYWTDSTGEGMRMAHFAKPFYLDDGSGRILIDPKDSEVKSKSGMFRIGMHQMILEEFQPPAGFAEGRLMPGDTVYVLGTVQIDRDRERRAGQANHPLIVKPAKTSLLRMNFYDLFFVSNISEEALLEAFRKSVVRGWYGVFLFMAISAWLALYAWTNIVQIKHHDLEAAPAYLRALSTPTELERELYVSGHGRRSRLAWLRELRRREFTPPPDARPDRPNAASYQPKDPNERIVRSLHKAGLAWLALPALTEAAADIDHRNFGVAHKWLNRLRGYDDALWGRIYFTDDAATGYETYVSRALLRFDRGQVYVSVRAYYSQKRKPGNDSVAGRKLVFELTGEDGGATHTAELYARPGWNPIDDEFAFVNIPPGRYTFDVYARTDFASGRHDRGTRRRKPDTVTF